MLITYSHPSLRRVAWVSELVYELRECGRARWVLTPDGLACLDGIGLRWYVARGRWPAKFGQPAGLWLVDSGELAVSADGRRWRRLVPVAGALDPAAVEEVGPVMEADIVLPAAVERPERWIAVLTPGLGVVAAELPGLCADVPHAVPASG